jgi:DnaA family protein
MSRLSYCTAIEVPEISQEEKIEALKQSSNRKGINLDTKTIQYIINNTSRSLSDLLQLINDIDSFSLKKKKKVSVSLVKEFLNTKN